VPTRRPWTERILQLVDAGITEREEIVRRTIPFVPQGHAYRVREITNARMRRRYGYVDAAPRNLNRTPGELHRVGAGAVINQAIHNLTRCGVLVRDGDHVRRRPKGGVS
jgi:hypothetical protein